MRLSSLICLLSASIILTCCNAYDSASLATQKGSAQEALLDAGSGALSLSQDSNYCLTSRDGKSDSGTDIVIDLCNGGASQNWSVNALGQISLFGNKCLDVADGTNENGARLQLWDCFAENINQKWVLQDASLMWLGKNKCVDLKDGVKQKNAVVQLWTCDAKNDNQKWSSSANQATAPVLSPASTVDPSSSAAEGAQQAMTLPATGYIASKYDPMTCLDRPVGQLESANRFALQQYQCNYTVPQTFTYSADGTLQASNEKLCLGVTASVNTSRGTTDLGMLPCEPNNVKQQWDFTSGAWRNRSNSLCLDMAQKFPSMGSRLVTAPCSASATQVWSQIVSASTKVADPLANQTSINGKCSPRVLFGFLTSDANAKKFKDNFPNFEIDILKATQEVCNTVFTSAAQVPTDKGILTVTVRSEENLLPAFSSGHEIAVNFDYIAAKISDNGLMDVPGMLRHEVTHFYHANRSGAPGWLTEGMADAVRFRLGYTLSVNAKGKSYTDGYGPVANFLLRLDKQFPNSLRQLFADTADANYHWDNSYFQTKMGKSLDTLWQEYQASL